MHRHHLSAVAKQPFFAEFFVFGSVKNVWSRAALSGRGAPFFACFFDGCRLGFFPHSHSIAFFKCVKKGGGLLDALMRKCKESFGAAVQHFNSGVFGKRTTWDLENEVAETVQQGLELRSHFQKSGLLVFREFRFTGGVLKEGIRKFIKTG